jgi:O-antigen ligase
MKINHKFTSIFSIIFDKTNFAVFLILLMVAGFLWSPALCSIAVFLFGFNCIRDVHPKLWLREKWWLGGLVWVGFFAVSWFWSADKHLWGEHFRVKLPFLLLPLAFGFLPSFNQTQIRIIIVALAVLFLAGCGNSLFQFLSRYEYYVQQYNVAHLFPTPVRNDYIRFSTALALFIVMSFSVWHRLGTGIAKWFTAVAAVLIFIYLHLLAAKSGLLSVYLFLFLWIVFYAVTQKKWWAVTLLLLLPAGFYFAAQSVPTLRTRLGYERYSMAKYKEGDLSGNYSDNARVMSYNIGVGIARAHPWLGVGTGDMLDSMKSQYALQYPQVKEENVLLPHNQLLIIAIGCGLPAMLCFVLWYVAPLVALRRVKNGFFAAAVWVVLLLQLLIEPVLEVQFGVFVFLFFLLLQRHLLKTV